jgi:putative ABC transport system permease protein
MFKRIPLAWLQLRHEKRRLLAATSGIAFAVLLMLMQLGYRDALFTASSLIQDRLQCDLVMLSKQYDYIVFPKSFPRARLYQALAFDGVQSVSPLYLGLSQWKNPEDLHERFMFVMAFDPSTKALSMPGLENPQRLQMPAVVLFDQGSRAEFGPVPKLLRENGVVRTEINGRRIEVIGLFMMGTSFGINGSVITSDLNYLRLFPGHSKESIELGLIRLHPGANAEQVRDQMEGNLPADVRVLTRQAFSEQEKDYWAVHTGIGFIFLLGMFMGFAVGAVIVYQILYTDVTDHLSEYATLKAIGYGNRYFFNIVMQEAAILSLLGFLPGLAIAEILYVVTKWATLLPLAMTVGRVILTLSLTMAMCGASGVIAMRKLRQADPATIFRA